MFDNRTISPENTAQLFKQYNHTGIVPFDGQPVTNAKPDDLEVALCDRFKTSSTDDSHTSFLTRLGMVADDVDDELRPTVAGVLMGTRNP